MKNIIMIGAALGLLYLIHVINPTFAEHKAAIAPDMELDSSVWDNLNYKDYAVVSFTANAAKGSMVSFGLCKYVKVVDDQWITAQQSQ